MNLRQLGLAEGAGSIAIIEAHQQAAARADLLVIALPHRHNLHAQSCDQKTYHYWQMDSATTSTLSGGMKCILVCFWTHNNMATKAAAPHREGPCADDTRVHIFPLACCRSVHRLISQIAAARLRRAILLLLTRPQAAQPPGLWQRLLRRPPHLLWRQPLWRRPGLLA